MFIGALFILFLQSFFWSFHPWPDINKKNKDCESQKIAKLSNFCGAFLIFVLRFFWSFHPWPDINQEKKQLWSWLPFINKKVCIISNVRFRGYPNKATLGMAVTTPLAARLCSCYLFHLPWGSVNFQQYASCSKSHEPPSSLSEYTSFSIKKSLLCQERTSLTRNLPHTPYPTSTTFQLE